MNHENPMKVPRKTAGDDDDTWPGDFFNKSKFFYSSVKKIKRSIKQTMYLYSLVIVWRMGRRRKVLIFFASDFHCMTLDCNGYNNGTHRFFFSFTCSKLSKNAFFSLLIWVLTHRCSWWSNKKHLESFIEMRVYYMK